MSDRPKPDEQRPVLAGIVALGAVALVVGVLAGLMVLVGTKVLGLGGDSTTAAADASSGESLFLPEFSESAGPSGPQLTLDPNGPTPSEGAIPAPVESETTEAPVEKAINLSSGQTSVAAMQQIDLSGTYPQGGGAILQVQRFEAGAWNNFPVTVSVSGETFATYVMTGQTGENKFRMVDSASGLESNEVVVQVN